MLLLVFFSSAFALFENSFTIKHLNKLEDFVKILESEFVSMVYFYSDQCTNCIQAAPLIDKVAEE